MARRILIIGPSWVGDMVMSQALYRLLKQQDPDCQIDVVAPAWTFPVLKRMPEVRRAIPAPYTHGELKLKQRNQLACELRREQYHQAIVLPNSFKSALIPFLARIPIRTGWLGEMRYGLLNDYRRLDKTRYPLMVQQYVALGLPKIAAAPTNYPYPKLHIQPEDQTAILNKLQITLTGKPILALGAGAEFGPSKRWPAEYFAQVAKDKLAQGWDVWLFGSPKDVPIIESIMQETQGQCTQIAGRTELQETIDVLSLVSGVISNDSGLMHLAAALDKPIIAIYGSTSPSFTPPLSQQAQILQLKLDCQPCFERECPLKHHRCMRDLKPAMVLQAMAAWGQ